MFWIYRRLFKAATLYRFVGNIFIKEYPPCHDDVIGKNWIEWSSLENEITSIGVLQISSSFKQVCTRCQSHFFDCSMKLARYLEVVEVYNPGP